MKKRNFFGLFLSLPVIVGIVSCNGDQKASRWQFSKEESSNFANYYANIFEENNGSKFKVETGMPLFTRDLTSDDILFFNLTKATEELEKSSSEVLDYSIIKNCLVPYTNLTTDEVFKGFELTFEYDPNVKYAAMIHKDIIDHGSSNAYFAYATEYISPEDATDPEAVEQEEFEKKYSESKFTWNNTQDFGLQVFNNIGSTIGGVSTIDPIATAKGIYSVLSTLGKIFLGDGPTIQDVMNKLYVVDKKLDVLISKIEENHQQLMKESVRTQTLVDLVLLNQQKAAIQAFTTDYVEKIDDYNRSLGAVFQTYYKDFVQNSQTIDVYLYKNTEGKWASRILSECGKYATDTKVEVNISTFDNSLKFLQDHGQIISDGFMNALYKDIDAALNKTSLPEGVERETMRYFVSSLISETFSKDYYSNNQLEAQNYANKVINISRRYSGKSGDSICGTYFERFKYMFNFGSEVKKPMATFTAKHMYYLDTNVAKAIEACKYAQINYDELVAEYKAARETLQTQMESVNNVPDNYSFILNYKLNGSFYNTYWFQSYENPGSHAILSGSLRSMRYNPGQYGGWTPEYVHLNERAFLSNIDHLRLVTRLELLKSLGYVKSDRSYLYYLADAKVMPTQTIRVRDELVDAKKIDPNCNRFFTTYSVRGLGDQDRSIIFRCDIAGNPKGNFFQLGQSYNYKSGHDAGCWHGETLETNWIDATTGGEISDKRVTARAWYEEHYWAWKNDELWAFNDYSTCTNFFALEIA